MEIVKVIRVGGVVLHCHIEHKKRRVRRLRLIHANDFVITGFVTYIFSDSFRFFIIFYKIHFIKSQKRIHFISVPSCTVIRMCGDRQIAQIS